MHRRHDLTDSYNLRLSPIKSRHLQTRKNCAIIKKNKDRSVLLMEYIPNGGQTYMPFQKNSHVQTLPFTPLEPPKPAYPALALNEASREKGYVITTQAQHFLPGVTAKMMDWW